MTKKSSITRRNFIKRTAVAGSSALAFPTIVSSSALGADGTVAPSNRIALGFIGTGDHGINVDLRGFLVEDDAQIVALCDVDQRHIDDALDVIGKRYEKQKEKGVATDPLPDTTRDWRELVARDDIDAVVVATPDHWHVLCGIAAAKTGKDVFCEKPISLTVVEGRVLSDTIREHGRVSITGSENRSKINFVKACELVRNGRIGKLHTIRTMLPGGRWIRGDFAGKDPQPEPVPAGFDYDMWLGQAPEAPYTEARCHWNWRWILDYSGGMLTDWGAHMNDIAQWGNGTERTGPVSVEGHGKFPVDGLYNTATEWEVTYKYANGVTLICTNGNVEKPDRGLASIRFEGTDGWISSTWWQLDASSRDILRSKIGPDEIHLRTCPEGEKRDFLNCVKSRENTYAPIEVGHRTITLSHIGNIAMILGRKLQWDPEKERFVDDDAANEKLSRKMRAPWTLDV